MSKWTFPPIDWQWSSYCILVKLTHKVHSELTSHINPLAWRHHLDAILVIVSVVWLALPPLAESGHGWALHIHKVAFSLQVINADIHSTEASCGDVASDGSVSRRVFGHRQVSTSPLTKHLRVPVAFFLLHQQIDLAVCLFDASDSCGGGQGWKMRIWISIITRQQPAFTQVHSDSQTKSFWLMGKYICLCAITLHIKMNNCMNQLDNITLL